MLRQRVSIAFETDVEYRCVAKGAVVRRFLEAALNTKTEV